MTMDKDRQPAPEDGRHTSATGALVALSLSMLLSSLGTSVANVALPTLAQSFAASFPAVQWVVLAYLLTVTGAIVTVGRLGDMTGRRRLLLAGLLLFTVASALCAAAPTLWVLIAARAVQGLGAAIMMALGMAFVGDIVPRARTGRAMGLLGTMSAIGTALGPSFGGLLIAGFGWRSIFLVNVPLGLAAFGLARRFLTADRAVAADVRAGFDRAGAVLLAVTLAAYALAVTGRGAFGPADAALLLAAAIGLGAFLFVERRASSPLIRLAMLRAPVLSAGMASSALVATVMMATLVVGPFYLALTLGLDVAQVGLVVSVGPAVVALSGIPAGWLADRIGAQRMAVGGLVAIAAGSAMLALIPETSGVPGYVASIVVVTAGYALFQTANNTAVMADIPPDRRGAVSGLLNLSRNLGLITGASLMGTIFARAAGSADLAAAGPAAVASGMRIAFAVATLLIAGALVAMLAALVRARRPVPSADGPEIRRDTGPSGLAAR